jgi:choline-glycine betaine transporter
MGRQRTAEAAVSLTPQESALHCTALQASRVIDSLPCAACVIFMMIAFLKKIFSKSITK